MNIMNNLRQFFGGAFIAAHAILVPACFAGEFRATALTPEYILVQGDSSADEIAAYFADPRAEEAKKAGQDWQVRRKQLVLHEDVEKKVRAPFAEKMKAIPGCIAYWPEANGMKHYVEPDGHRFIVKAGEVIHNAFVKVPPMKRGDKVDLGFAGAFVGVSARAVETECDVRGMSLDEALLAVDMFLDGAVLNKLGQVYIIHGKGTGILRSGIQQHLKKHPAIRSFRLGKYGEGEDGVTVATLK